MIKILLFAISNALFFLILRYLFPSFIHPQVWQILVFLTLLTLAGVFIIRYFAKKGEENFVIAFFGTMVIRLIASVAFVGVFVFMKIPDLLSFMIHFILLYLFFLSFEIYVLLSNLRRNSQS